MAFYVNEDRPTRRATLHRDDCFTQVPRPKLRRDGHWHGPIDSIADAIRVAIDTGLTHYDCRRCRPEYADR